MLRTFAARNNKRVFEVWHKLANIAIIMSIMSTSTMSMIMNTSIIMSTICVRSFVSSS